MVTSPRDMSNLNQKMEQHNQQHQQQNQRNSNSKKKRPRTSKGGGTTPTMAPATAAPQGQKQQQQHHVSLTPQSKKSLVFSSPSPAKRDSHSSRSSATPSPKSSCYAASKCYGPPTPDSLPRPPTNWTSKAKEGETKATTSSPLQALVSSMQHQQKQQGEMYSGEAVSRHLMVLLGVTA